MPKPMAKQKASGSAYEISYITTQASKILIYNKKQFRYVPNGLNPGAYSVAMSITIQDTGREPWADKKQFINKYDTTLTIAFRELRSKYSPPDLKKACVVAQ